MSRELSHWLRLHVNVQMKPTLESINMSVLTLGVKCGSSQTAASADDDEQSGSDSVELSLKS